MGNTFGGRRIFGWGNIRPSHSDVVCVHEGYSQISQPVRIGRRIVVNVGDDLSRGGLQTGVARSGKAAVFRSDQTKTVLRSDFFSAVGRAIVYYDHFVIGIVESHQAIQAFPKRTSAVVSADDHRNLWPAEILGKWNFAKSLSDSDQSRFGTTITRGNTEGPIFNICAASVPFIGPGEYKCACAARGESGSQLPIEYVCLFRFPVAKTVEPHFAHNQGPVTGEVL